MHIVHFKNEIIKFLLILPTSADAWIDSFSIRLTSGPIASGPWLWRLLIFRMSALQSVMVHLSIIATFLFRIQIKNESLIFFGRFFAKDLGDFLRKFYFICYQMNKQFFKLNKHIFKSNYTWKWYIILENKHWNGLRTTSEILQVH